MNMKNRYPHLQAQSLRHPFLFLSTTVLIIHTSVHNKYVPTNILIYAQRQKVHNSSKSAFKLFQGVKGKIYFEN